MIGRPSATVTRAATLVLVVTATAVLGRAAAAFEVAPGVALVFPAAALAVVAAVLLGGGGVVAAFVGFLVFPWGLKTSAFTTVYFAFAAALLGVVPWLARLRSDGPVERRLARALLACVGANSLLSALVGAPAAVRLAPSPVGTDLTLVALGSWMLGDVVSIVVLALPALAVLRPELLMEPSHIELMRAWLRRRGRLLAVAAMTAAVALGMELLAPAGRVSLHWLAAFFAIPVIAGAIQGSVGGGIIATGLVGCVYLVQVLHLIRPGSDAELFVEVFSSYLNIVVFAGAAIVVGVFSGRTRTLVAELADHRRRLERSFEHVVTALAAAIEAKDPMTEGHVQRVATLAGEVGRRLGLDGARLDLLRYAATLHDVGKIGVPEEVLGKPGSLSEEERELMDRHVKVGVDILSSVDVLAPAIPFIRFHQERWDGRTDGRFRGVHGLKGEEIPLEARIIAAVDAFDAMTSDRPYRKALRLEDALAELNRESGAQFDPAVVAALKQALAGRGGGEAIAPSPSLG